MAKSETKGQDKQQEVTYSGDEFTSLLTKEFRPKTDQAKEAVEKAVRTLAEQALAGAAVTSDVVVTIEGMVAALDRSPDLVCALGSRVRLLGYEIERKAVRHYAGRVFGTLASFTLGIPVYDTQCGAKLFRSTEETRALFEKEFLAGWTFDVEVFAR